MAARFFAFPSTHPRTHFPLQPAARKPPQETLSTWCVRNFGWSPGVGGGFGWRISGGDVSISGQSGSVGGERVMGPSRRWPHFSLYYRAHNLLFCTELYAHEQRICGRQAFFLRLCADEAGGGESQGRRRIPEETNSDTNFSETMVRQRRLTNGMGCVLKIWFCFGDTSRAELKFSSFRSNVEEMGGYAAAVVWRVINLIGSHYSSVSHDVCLSSLCGLSRRVFFTTYPFESDTNGQSPAATSHPSFRHRIFGNAIRSSQNDRLTSPSSR